ncbi:hypothetical protein HYH03_006527 [Edaphochlamys debaryana]|uniref:EF-hand domain-containing protein n=1 Tax=Edaphochlamys debaryana TaxID=47281 RepID=A0A835Y512_9CHLO|nr:hypothetical protein HYH03_006527 [Edaphochlamys debaryana]|eukprot:KAG2495254.1 hypothetical protein HYH03_006527 [Edaphochlamys debaryana]
MPSNKGNFVKCDAKPAPGFPGSLIYVFYTPFSFFEKGPFHKVDFEDKLYKCAGGWIEKPKEGWLDYVRRAGPSPGHKKETRDTAEYFCPPCWAGVAAKEERAAVNDGCARRVASREHHRYAAATASANRTIQTYAHQGAQDEDALRWESAGAACACCNRELPKNAGSWKIGEAGVVCFFTEFTSPAPLRTAGFQPPHWAASDETRPGHRVLDYVRRLREDKAPCNYYCVPCWAKSGVSTAEERAGTTRACRSHGIGVLAAEEYDSLEGDCANSVGDVSGLRGLSTLTSAQGTAKQVARGVVKAGCIVSSLLLPGSGMLIGGVADAVSAAGLKNLANDAPGALRFFDSSGDGVLSVNEMRSGIKVLADCKVPNAMYARALLQFLEALHMRYRAAPDRMKKQLSRAVGGRMQKGVVKKLISSNSSQRDPLLVWGIVAWYTSKTQQKIASAISKGQVQLSDGSTVKLAEAPEGLFMEQAKDLAMELAESEVSGFLVDLFSVALDGGF